MTQTAAIEIHGLCNRFGDQVIHDQLELAVRYGEILGVVGGSGTGKSMLMRTILGLHAAQDGAIRVLGNPLVDDPQAWHALHRRTGVLFQDGALFSSLTVLENVEIPFKAHYPQIPPAQRQKLARLKLRMAGLAADADDKLPSELSGGMRKRAGLARALALEPELLFLDEPTAGLDPIGAAAFDQLLLSLKQALGLTVFLITHDLDTLYAICDRIAVIGEQRVLAIGTVAEVERHEHPWIREYFHGPRARAAREGRLFRESQDGNPG